MSCAAQTQADHGARAALDAFATRVGLAFQIRDDLLDVTGDESVVGKTHGADAAHHKSTFPALLGVRAAEQRCDALYAEALRALEPLGEAAQPLRWMADHLVHRDR
jgi:geranylgeranyl diphosphate synthase type II